MDISHDMNIIPCFHHIVHMKSLNSSDYSMIVHFKDYSLFLLRRGVDTMKWKVAAEAMTLRPVIFTIGDRNQSGNGVNSSASARTR